MYFYPAESGSKGRVSSREVARLRQQNESFLEENNLLKLKVELLLDMVWHHRTWQYLIIFFYDW